MWDVLASASLDCPTSAQVDKWNLKNDARQIDHDAYPLTDEEYSFFERVNAMWTGHKSSVLAAQAADKAATRRQDQWEQTKRISASVATLGGRVQQFCEPHGA